MRYIKNFVLVFMVFCSLVFLFGCTTTEKVSVSDIKNENIKVKVEITGGYELCRYVVYLLDDNRVISYDSRKLSERASIISVEDEMFLLMIDNCVTELQKCEKEMVDFNLGASDLYQVHMCINGRDYSFDYGCAQNPYANILTEIMLAHSDVDGLENIESYIFTIR